MNIQQEGSAHFYGVIEYLGRHTLLSLACNAQTQRTNDTLTSCRTRARVREDPRYLSHKENE